MMRGKIKPKEKEEEPEMPTLRKRPVTKDKVYSKSCKIKKSYYNSLKQNTNHSKYLLGRGEKARRKTKG